MPDDPIFWATLPLILCLLRYLTSFATERHADRTVRPPKPDLFNLTHNVPPPPRAGISDDDWQFAIATCRGLHGDTVSLVTKFLDNKIDGWEFADAVAALPAPEPVPPRLSATRSSYELSAAATTTWNGELSPPIRIARLPSGSWARRRQTRATSTTDLADAWTSQELRDHYNRALAYRDPPKPPRWARGWTTP